MQAWDPCCTLVFLAALWSFLLHRTICSSAPPHPSRGRTLLQLTARDSGNNSTRRHCAGPCYYKKGGVMPPPGPSGPPAPPPAPPAPPARPCTGCGALLKGVHFPGADISGHATTSSPEECCGLCKAARGCVGFAFHGAGIVSDISGHRSPRRAALLVPAVHALAHCNATLCRRSGDEHMHAQVEDGGRGLACRRVRIRPV